MHISKPDTHLTDDAAKSQRLTIVRRLSVLTLPHILSVLGRDDVLALPVRTFVNFHCQSLGHKHAPHVAQLPTGCFMLRTSLNEQR